MWRGRWDGRTDGPRDWVTYEEFQELRDRSGIFASVMASQSSLGLWQARIDGEALEEVRGRMVSGAYFQVLGANPAAGRVFTADADRVDTPEAVISHSFWQRRFGGRDDVIGRTLTIRNATALDRRHHAAGVRRRDQRSAARTCGCRCACSRACCPATTTSTTRRPTRRCGCTCSAG